MTDTEPRAPSLSRRIQFVLASNLGPWLVRGLCGSVRWSWDVHDTTARHLDAGRNALYAHWHGHLLSLTYTHRNRGIVVLVSRNDDGELITRVLDGMGFDTARGSTSRGGSAAMKALLRAAREGRSVGITPDGPRGPRHQVQDGVTVLAALSGLPIIPLAASASALWRLPSWDRFEIPRPFARGAVVMDELLWVPREATREEARWRSRIRETLMRTTERAERLARGEPFEEMAGAS